MIEINDKYDLNTFESDLKELNIILNFDQKKQFIKYYELLIQWNSYFNLTAITEYDEVCKKHFIDSLSLNKCTYLTDYLTDTLNKVSLIDVGTGAGFPGIPLKIAFPHLKVVLLDSSEKRVSFLNHVINGLQLQNISAIHSRAEDAARAETLREKFDLCVSRAVANLTVLSEYCIPFIKKEGYFISYKANITAEELEHAKKAISVLGGKIIDKTLFSLPSASINRCLISIIKTKSTSAKYPRKAGTPAKIPLD